jgi:hypothetical protein
MSEALTTWERPCFEPGGGNAFLLFAVYGQFKDLSEGSGLEYRTEGLPLGVQAHRVTHAGGGELPFMTGEMARVAREDNPDGFDLAQTAAECLVLQGEVADPPDLNYLRDIIGLIAWWFDHGAVAALDAQRLKLYDSVAWCLDLFAPLPPRLLNHVIILGSKDDGHSWLRTRGMRKFGRPDLSMRHVGIDAQGLVAELFNRLLMFQAQGGRIQDGQSVRLTGLPDGITCRLRGALDDPEFNNQHIELCWPGTYSF